MAFADEINRDVREVQATLNLFFKWPAADGEIYPCTQDKAAVEETVSDDGNPFQIDLRLRTQEVLFPEVLPESGQLLRYPVSEDGSDLPKSQNYRVRRSEGRQLGILWIWCIDKNV